MLLCTLLAKEAFMSQIFYETFSLDELVRHSEVILRGCFESEGKKPNPVRLFKVKQVINQRDTSARIPTYIRISTDPSYELRQAMWRHIQAQGYSGIPSPIVESYSNPLKQEPAKGEEVLLFLISSSDEEADFRLAVEGAYEATGKEAEILSILHSMKHGESIDADIVMEHAGPDIILGTTEMNVTLSTKPRPRLHYNAPQKAGPQVITLLVATPGNLFTKKTFYVEVK